MPRCLIVTNRTEDHIRVQALHSHSLLESLQPSDSADLAVSSGRLSVTLLLSVQNKTDKVEPAQDDTHAFKVACSLVFGPTCTELKAPATCPWLIYCSKVDGKNHKVLILPKRNMSSFLGDIPDSVPLSSLSLPATHDTMALHGWPISQCQTASLAAQLKSGMRVLDIRLAVKKRGLIAYHGSVSQRVPFKDILQAFHDFLTEPGSQQECLVVSIKQEDFATVQPPIFSQHVRDEITAGPGGMGMWFLENRIPTLGEARGKIVMLSRFGGDGNGWQNGLEGLGIHPTTWPDSLKAGFTWQCKNTLVQTHDWYNIPSFLSIPEKVSLATSILLPPPNDLPTPTLSITYISASSFPLGLPPVVARGFGWPDIGLGVEGANSRVGKWLLDLLGGKAEPRVRGWVFMDFYQYPRHHSVVPLLVECNFRGRVQGQEGWPLAA